MLRPSQVARTRSITCIEFGPQKELSALNTSPVLLQNVNRLLIVIRIIRFYCYTLLGFFSGERIVDIG